MDSDDGTTPSLFRTASAQSLPATSSDGISAMSLYQRTLYMLANDPGFQKEVALGKRVGFYRLGKELGSGNFSKVKLGIHVLAKGVIFKIFIIFHIYPYNNLQCIYYYCY
ncbi:unnamed protein product [Anisakis simplex]|uniref:Protein kinase domain-containing protein n=1 Tax=Anisakis simplex TaxID=6269 RepID=A0A0M3JMV0_ANISI|nr:unnamed protein product [Anisakis simplex]